MQVLGPHTLFFSQSQHVAQSVKVPVGPSYEEKLFWSRFYPSTQQLDHHVTFVARDLARKGLLSYRSSSFTSQLNQSLDLVLETLSGHEDDWILIEVHGERELYQTDYRRARYSIYKLLNKKISSADDHKTLLAGYLGTVTLPCNLLFLVA